MRISTNTIYQSGISKINNLQSEQVKLQGQISTGQRMASPSDDPVAAARALEISHAQSINNKFADTRQTAQLKLSGIESNLTSITNVLVATSSSLIAAGNATFSDQDRGFIALELTNTLDAMLSLANKKDTYGNYLHAGFKIDVPPFIANALGATYMGDSNAQLLQVDAQRQMAVNITGDSIFQAGGNDLFASLKDLVALLNTPLTPATQAAYTAGIATGMASVQAGLDNVLNLRAGVGFKLNELEALDTAGSDRGIQYSRSLSDLQDLDYAAALSDLSKNQTIMEAAQKSFVATTSLTLFDFI